MNIRQYNKIYKRSITVFVTILANDGRIFKSKEAKKLWISETVKGICSNFPVKI